MERKRCDRERNASCDKSRAWPVALAACGGVSFAGSFHPAPVDGRHSKIRVHAAPRFIYRQPCDHCFIVFIFTLRRTDEGRGVPTRRSACRAGAYRQQNRVPCSHSRLTVRDTTSGAKNGLAHPVRFSVARLTCMDLTNVSHALGPQCQSSQESR